MYFAWYSNPRFFASFFSIVCIWSFYVIFLSIITPKKFIEVVLSIELLAILRSGSFKGMLSLTDFLWNKVYLVFLTFNDNLLAMNYRLIFSSSWFTVAKSVLILLLEKKRLVSSANMMGSIACLTRLEGNSHKLKTVRVLI